MISFPYCHFSAVFEIRKLSRAETTLVQHEENCNTSFPHHLLLQSRDRNYKVKEFSLKNKKIHLKNV